MLVPLLQVQSPRNPKSFLLHFVQPPDGPVLPSGRQDLPQCTQKAKMTTDGGMAEGLCKGTLPNLLLKV